MITTTLRGAALAASLISVCVVCLPGRMVHSANDNKAAPRGGRDAAATYVKSCATCHGKDGRAKTFKARFNNARNLTDAEWQAAVSDERLYNSISNGRGKMPAFGKKFSEEEINGLVAYVRRLRRQTVTLTCPNSPQGSEGVIRGRLCHEISPGRLR